MSSALRLAELTRDQVAEIAPDAILVLPFGAVEQHGPHLPFGTDLLVVETLCRRAVDRADAGSPVVLAPAVAYGSSAHHLDVGGALSVGATAFEACARDLFLSAAASGFRRIFAVNGHGGNEELLRVAAQATSRERPLSLAGGAYWTLARAELEQLLPHPTPIPGHAGRFETSLLLALQPDLDADAPERDVPLPATATPFWHEESGRWRAIDGFTDNPADGSVEEGAACMEAIVTALARCIADFDRWTRETVPA